MKVVMEVPPLKLDPGRGQYNSSRRIERGGRATHTKAEYVPSRKPQALDCVDHPHQGGSTGFIRPWSAWRD